MKFVLLVLISFISQLHAVMPIRNNPEEAIRQSLDYIWNTMFPMGNKNNAYRDEFFQLTVQKDNFDIYWNFIVPEKVNNTSFWFNMSKNVRSLYEIREVKQIGSSSSTASGTYQLYKVTYRVQMKNENIAWEYSTFNVKQLDDNSWQVCSWISNVDTFNSWG